MNNLAQAVSSTSENLSKTCHYALGSNKEMFSFMDQDFKKKVRK